jgi:hypothetical protein
MEKVKSIYDYTERIFDVEEIKAICKQFGVNFEVFDVECNSSDEAILLKGKLTTDSGEALSTETQTELKQSLFDSGDWDVTADIYDNLLELKFEEQPDGRD